MRFRRPWPQCSRPNGCRILEVPVSSYLTAPWDNVNVVTFQVDVTPKLRTFEQKIVDAVQPFAVSGGTAEAFAIAAGDVPVGKATIAWVENFVAASSGRNFRAHVTLGVAPKEFADWVEGEAVREVHGQARRRRDLSTWEFRHGSEAAVVVEIVLSRKEEESKR